jgi:hypothetical protein
MRTTTSYGPGARTSSASVSSALPSPKYTIPRTPALPLSYAMVTRPRSTSTAPS